MEHCRTIGLLVVLLVGIAPEVIARLGTPPLVESAVAQGDEEFAAGTGSSAVARLETNAVVGGHTSQSVPDECRSFARGILGLLSKLMNSYWDCSG